MADRLGDDGRALVFKTSQHFRLFFRFYFIDRKLGVRISGREFERIPVFESIEKALVVYMHVGLRCLCFPFHGQAEQRLPPLRRLGPVDVIAEHLVGADNGPPFSTKDRINS